MPAPGLVDLRSDTLTLPDSGMRAAMARAERRLAILSELTEIGMNLARKLDRETPEPEAPAAGESREETENA